MPDAAIKMIFLLTYVIFSCSGSVHVYQDISEDSLGRDSEGEPELYDENFVTPSHEKDNQESSDTVKHSIENQKDNRVDPMTLIRAYGNVDTQEIGRDNEGDPIIDGEVLSTMPDMPMEEQIRKANLVGSEDHTEQDVYSIMESAKLRKRRGELSPHEQGDLRRLIEVINQAHDRKSNITQVFNSSSLHKDIPLEEIGSDSEGEPIDDNEQSVMYHGIHHQPHIKETKHHHDEL